MNIIHTKPRLRYIYEARTHSLYLRKDYDFTEDIFTIENTDISIRFFDAVTSKVHTVFKIEDSVGVDCTLYSKNHPTLQMFLKVFQHESIWYVSTAEGDVYEISEAFIELLVQNKIISN